MIATLTIETKAIEFEKAKFKLSNTSPFHWRRNLPPLVARRPCSISSPPTIPSNENSRSFLTEKEDDVLRFASLGTTEQGESGSQFRIDYLKPSGAIGFYHPDWVVIQKTHAGEINWIIETKGRKWEGTDDKDLAMSQWCERITDV